MTTTQIITIVTALQFYEESGRISAEEYSKLLQAIKQVAGLNAL